MSNLIQMSEKIRDHLTQQRKQSMHIDPSMKLLNQSQETCAYRGDNGLMCAVGCLINDANYDKDLEGNCADELFVVKAVERSLGFQMTSDAVQMTGDWQCYHDDEVDGFGYINWINGDEAQSPAAFHDVQVLKYA